MTSVSYAAIEEIVGDIAARIPGPQDGESAFAYRARVTGQLMEVVEAVSAHKRRVDAFIHDRSEARGEPADQFYNAVRQRFISDGFGD